MTSYMYPYLRSVPIQLYIYIYVMFCCVAVKFHLDGPTCSIQRSVDKKVSPSRSALKQKPGDNTKSSLSPEKAAAIRKESVSPSDDVSAYNHYITLFCCSTQLLVHTVDRGIFAEL